MEETDSASEGEGEAETKKELSTKKRQRINDDNGHVLKKKAKYCITTVVNGILLADPKKQFSVEEICQAVHEKDPAVFEKEDSNWRNAVQKTLYKSRKVRKHPGGLWSAKYKTTKQKTPSPAAPATNPASDHEWEDEEAPQPVKERKTGE